MWTVQSLAQDASVQVKLFPGFAEVADELVLEHEQYQNLFLQSKDADTLTSSQLSKISELDSYIENLSEENRKDLWTVSALRNAPEWDEIRRLSKQVIREMQWDDARPPSSQERGNFFIQEA